MLDREPPEPRRDVDNSEKEKKLEQAKEQYTRLYLLLEMLSILDDYQTVNEKNGRNLFDNEDSDENWKNMIRAIFGDKTTGEHDKRAQKLVDQYKLTLSDDISLFEQLRDIAQYWFEQKKILPPTQEFDAKTPQRVISEVAHFIRSNLLTEGTDIKSFLRVLKQHSGKVKNIVNPAYAYELSTYVDKDESEHTHQFKAQLNYLQKLEFVLDSTFFGPSDDLAHGLLVKNTSLEMNDIPDFYEKNIFYNLIRTDLIFISKLLGLFQKDPDSFSLENRNSTVENIFNDVSRFATEREQYMRYFSSEPNPKASALNHMQTVVEKWLVIFYSAKLAGNTVEVHALQNASEVIAEKIQEGFNPPIGSNIDPQNYLKDLTASHMLNPAEFEIKRLSNQLGMANFDADDNRYTESLEIIRKFLDVLHFPSRIPQTSLQPENLSDDIHYESDRKKQLEATLKMYRRMNKELQVLIRLQEYVEDRPRLYKNIESRKKYLKLIIEEDKKIQVIRMKTGGMDFEEALVMLNQWLDVCGYLNDDITNEAAEVNPSYILTFVQEFLASYVGVYDPSNPNIAVNFLKKLKKSGTANPASYLLNQMKQNSQVSSLDKDKKEKEINLILAKNQYLPLIQQFLALRYKLVTIKST